MTSIFTIRYLSKKKYIYTYNKVYIYNNKDLCAKIYSSFTQNRQKLETIQMSFSVCLGILWHNDRIEYYSTIKIEGILIHPTHKWINLEHILISERI